MSEAIQIIANGLVIGLTVLLVAMGFQLVLGVMRIVNFAHGELYMLGAYIVWYMKAELGVNYWVAIPISMAFVVVFGLFIERYLLRNLRGRLLPQIVITFGILLILQSAVHLTFGIETKGIHNDITGVLSFAGARISKERVIVCVISLVLVAITLALWRWTKTGMAIRAMAQEPDAARLQGVNLTMPSRLTMGVACGLAAAAGGLIGPVFSVDVGMGGHMLLQSLVVVAVAGMGSLGGTLIAALAMGLMDSAVTTLASSEVAAMIYFALLAVVLVVRPTGLFGQELEVE